MRFLWSDLLWLLLSVPLLIGAYVYALRRRKKLALRYASLMLVRGALGPAVAVAASARGAGGLALTRA
jgi:Ca-activated chloride channel family protein